jgi:hypothetical protein
MKFKIFALTLTGMALFLAGVLLEIAISGSILWGELETRLYTAQSGDRNLAVSCPLVISLHETASISTSITNSLDEDVHPVIDTSISQIGSSQDFSETLDLAAHESKTLAWQADASNIIYGRLILVNIEQRSYRDLPSRQGYCSIVLLNVPGLRGWQALMLLCLISLVCLIAGSLIWLRNHSLINEQNRNVARPFISLAGLSTLALITAAIHWWGLVILLDGAALMLIGVIFTEVLPKSNQSGA